MGTVLTASVMKLTTLQVLIAILLVCVCTPDLGCTGGNNDIDAGTDTDFDGACMPTLYFPMFSFTCMCNHTVHCSFCGLPLFVGNLL